MVPDEPIAGPLKAATRMLMTGRSSLIAASLFGASAMMGCPSDDGSSGSADVSEDTAVDTAEDAQLDIPNAAAYGLPPEPDTTQLEDVASDTMEEDVGPVDLYGAPPMEDVEEDTAADAEPMPEYGAPPMEDVAEDTAPDPEPQPEYGAPPMDEDTSDPE
jgi:hypothetical protein